MKQKLEFVVIDSDPTGSWVTKKILKDATGKEVHSFANPFMGLDFISSVKEEDLHLTIFIDSHTEIMDIWDFLERFDRFSDSCDLVVMTASFGDPDVEKIKSGKNVQELVSKPIQKVWVQSLLTPAKRDEERLTDLV